MTKFEDDFASIFREFGAPTDDQKEAMLKLLNDTHGPPFRSDLWRIVYLQVSINLHLLTMISKLARHEPMDMDEFQKAIKAERIMTDALLDIIAKK